MDGRKDFSQGCEGAVIRLALVGIGKTARDQHLPGIAAASRYQLLATGTATSRSLPIAGE